MHLLLHVPTKLKGYSIHKNIVASLLNQLSNPLNATHFLFEGPPGTGKTTLAQIFAKQLVSNNQTSILELNASNQRGIDVIRNRVGEFISTSSFKTPLKVVILDEADFLTKEAQAALRQMMQKYCERNKFILTCNQVDKLDPALISRCKRIYVPRLTRPECVTFLKQLVTVQNLNISKTHFDSLIDNCAGDLRYLLNNLTSENNMNITDSFIEDLKNVGSSTQMLKYYTKSIYNKISSKILVDKLFEWSVDKMDELMFLEFLPVLAQADAKLTEGCNEKIQIVNLLLYFRKLCNSN